MPDMRPSKGRAYMCLTIKKKRDEDYNRGSDRGLGVSREGGRLHGGGRITMGFDAKPDLAGGARPWRVFADATPYP